MTLIACLFLKLHIVKDLVGPISKKPHLIIILLKVSKRLQNHYYSTIFITLGKSELEKVCVQYMKSSICLKSSICCNQVKCNCLKNKKLFSRFFALFLISTSNFKQFEEMTILKCYLSPKLQTLKGLVRTISKKPCYRTPFDSHFVKNF